VSGVSEKTEDFRYEEPLDELLEVHKEVRMGGKEVYQLLKEELIVLTESLQGQGLFLARNSVIA